MPTGCWVAGRLTAGLRRPPQWTRRRSRPGRRPSGRRPRQHRLHLRHHRYAQGLRADPPQPARRASTEPSRCSPRCSAAPTPAPAVAAAGPRVRPAGPVRLRTGRGHPGVRPRPSPPRRRRWPRSGPPSCWSSRGCSRSCSEAARARGRRTPRAGAGVRPAPRRRRPPTAAPWTPRPGPGRCCAPDGGCSTGWSTAGCASSSAAGAGTRSAAGAPLRPDLAHFLRGAGLTVLEGYGLTETSGALTVNPPEAPRIGTVGRPLPGVRLRLAADGEVLAAGEMVVAGYWGARRAAHRRGRLVRTPATSARWDDAGYLRDHRTQEGSDRHRRRQERRAVAAGGTAERPPADRSRYRGRRPAAVRRRPHRDR